MALQACRECGQRVSTLVATCPHCGDPEPTLVEQSGPSVGADASQPRLGPPKPTSNFTNLGVGCLLAFAFIVVLFIAAGINGSGVNEKGDSRTPTAADSATAV